MNVFTFAARKSNIKLFGVWESWHFEFEDAHKLNLHSAWLQPTAFAYRKIGILSTGAYF